MLQFEVRGDGDTPTELRTLLEWDIAPGSHEVHGVTDINTHGGYYKSFEVRPEPERLANHGVTLQDIAAAIESNNLSAGGGYAVYHGEQRFIRGHSVLATQPISKKLFVVRRESDGHPCSSEIWRRVSTGELTREGRHARRPRRSRHRASNDARRRKFAACRRAGQEAARRDCADYFRKVCGWKSFMIAPSLIGRTLRTIVTNLVEGGALVIIVLLLMLGSLRAGLITALAIPLSMMFATN